MTWQCLNSLGRIAAEDSLVRRGALLINIILIVSASCFPKVPHLLAHGAKVPGGVCASIVPLYLDDINLIHNSWLHLIPLSTLVVASMS